MILLDTDHLTVMAYPPDRRHADLASRLRRAGDSDVVAATVISVEEHTRGWLAVIAKAPRDPIRQSAAYDRLTVMIRFFAGWEIVPWDLAAVGAYERLVQQRVRIGTQDLKIASIALTRDALLLSANLKDFRKVPRLRVENWLS